MRVFHRPGGCPQASAVGRPRLPELPSLPYTGATAALGDGRRQRRWSIRIPRGRCARCASSLRPAGAPCSGPVWSPRCSAWPPQSCTPRPDARRPPCPPTHHRWQTEPRHHRLHRRQRGPETEGADPLTDGGYDHHGQVLLRSRPARPSQGRLMDRRRGGLGEPPEVSPSAGGVRRAASRRCHPTARPNHGRCRQRSARAAPRSLRSGRRRGHRLHVRRACQGPRCSRAARLAQPTAVDRAIGGGDAGQAGRTADRGRAGQKRPSRRWRW